MSESSGLALNYVVGKSRMQSIFNQYKPVFFFCLPASTNVDFFFPSHQLIYVCMCVCWLCYFNTFMRTKSTHTHTQADLQCSLVPALVDVFLPFFLAAFSPKKVMEKELVEGEGTRPSGGSWRSVWENISCRGSQDCRSIWSYSVALLLGVSYMFKRTLPWGLWGKKFELMRKRRVTFIWIGKCTAKTHIRCN